MSDYDSEDAMIVSNFIDSDYAIFQGLLLTHTNDSEAVSQRVSSSCPASAMVVRGRWQYFNLCFEGLF